MMKLTDCFSAGLRVLTLLWLVGVAAGCAAIPTECPPALVDVEVEELTASGEPAEMVRVAGWYVSYSTPLEKQMAAFKLAQRAYLMDRSNREAALLLAKSALLLSGVIKDEGRKEEVVRKGYEAAFAAGGEGDDPEAAYYFGTLLGLLIEKEGLTAAGEVPRFEQALERALKQPETDRGGPVRVLGMLYLRAPAWPAGAGDLERALEYLERAAREFPGHPENHLFYAYALSEDDRPEEARAELERAVATLSGGEWGDFAPLWREEINKFREELDN
ncbi:MAG: tetratricopeptide repeat protein [PVC group bacterium]